VSPQDAAAGAILNHTNAVHTLPSQLFKIHFNSIRKLMQIFVANASNISSIMCLVRDRRSECTCTCAQSFLVDTISVNPADHHDRDWHMSSCKYLHSADVISTCQRSKAEECSSSLRLVLGAAIAAPLCLILSKIEDIKKREKRVLRVLNFSYDFFQNIFSSDKHVFRWAGTAQSV
jgi:hypothetical protein